MSDAGTKSRNGQIVALWHEGTLTYRQIAIEVGCTKGVVSGLIRDLKLVRGKPAASVPVSAPNQRGIIRKFAPLPRQTVTYRRRPGAERYDSLGEALTALKGGCRWPSEDEQGHYFCGADRATGPGDIVRSYCACHYEMSIRRRTGLAS